MNLRSIVVERIRGLRPAPLASAIARISRLDRRRFVQTEHGAFFVNPMSNLGSRLLLGEYEQSTTALLSQYLKPGAVFVDLGANEGYFTVIASRVVGPGGRVFAIEPQSRLPEVLETNLRANYCRNVRLIKAVVSSKTERMQLALISDMNTGATSFIHKHEVSTSHGRSPQFYPR
jgi:protein-L-isoaspartate O-methyltransferase